MQLRFRQTVFLLMPLLAACSSIPDIKVTDYLSPYRIDINQGNYITQEMVVQLKPGQTREQVRFILGSPLIVDAFHGGDRWDYLYRFQPGVGAVQTRRLVVFFTDGKLTRVGGDVMAGSAADLAVTPAPAATVIDIAPAPATK
ncbi:MAG TPA: outer membrane protein assembly factor BamE [Rhodocyclaceae bacterium]|jgi:outer membrane protein assembly factor BamE